MISAYTDLQISALRHRQKAQRWLKAGIVAQHQRDLIHELHPHDLYTPHWGMRILGFLAGLTAVWLGVTLFFLSLLDEFDESLGFLLLLVAAGCLAFVERELIKARKHFRSGFVQAFYYSAFAAIAVSCSLVFKSEPFTTFIVLVLAALAAARYLDRVMAAQALVSLAYLLYLLFDALPSAAVFFLPVFLSAIYAFIYLFVRRLRTNGDFWKWADVLAVVETVALILAYLCINLYVVSTAATELMYLEGELPLRWLFTFLTVAIPPLALFFGWRLRDRILLRVALLLCGIAVLTLKYYYSLGMPEVSLTVAGAVLLVLGFVAERYFGASRKGVTSRQHGGKEGMLLGLLKATQASKAAEVPAEESPFGGGRFGGGGAQGGF